MRILFFYFSFFVCGIFPLFFPLFAEEELCLTEEPFVFDSQEGESRLMQDLLIANYWTQRLNEKFPVSYDHLLQGGYFNMPSARMGEEGEIAFGFGYVPPYLHYNLRFQLTNFLEVTGSYRIFKGVEDPVLTPLGYGDFSDKGANVKLSLFSPEESRYTLPGLAIGLEDFIGTRSFKTYYVVLTQVFLKQNLEISFGYGAHRIHKWFGGLVWMPFRHKSMKLLQPLAIVLEYDSIPYRDEVIEKHPKGRIKRTPWQVGLKYRLWEQIDFSFAYIRGDKLAFTVSTFYNFGSTKGLVPKIGNTLPYQSPINFQPIGEWRPDNIMIQEFVYAFRAQGFELSEAWISDDNGRTVLRLYVTNTVYREERLVRLRLNALLSSLVPENIDEILVTIDTAAMSIQELRYETAYLRLFHDREIGPYELNIVTPLSEASKPNPYTSKLLFKKEWEKWNLELLPKTQTLFGSSKGKFKYALGLSLNINGLIWQRTFYSISLGYFLFSDLKHVNDIDRLNPSQLINVRSDLINYYKQRCVTIDEAYIEKVWNCGKGWYTRLSVGLFEQEYGGVAGEWLFYPFNSPWAVGMDFAVVKKRTPEGVGFTSRARKLNGFKPHHVKFLGTQFFLNLYYDWKCTGLEFKVSIGRFLAYDVGMRTEVSRYFPSGLRLGFWYTYTNGKDIINNQVYHDKGIFFSVPLDIFYTKTSRSRWGYGMSAWLRDVGATAFTGNHLYEMINQERQ